MLDVTWREQPFIGWMEDRQLDHQLVAEVPMTMRCYNLLTLNFITIIIIVNSYTIVIQHIVRFLI